MPFHMPGAKRNADLRLGEPFSMDLTEVDGLDNLHNAKGVIAADMLRASEMFRADEALFLVNGSTAGILAAVSGAVMQRDKVLVARNSHISVINALITRGLTPVYVVPERGDCGIYKGVTAASVREALANDPDIKAVIITSPTYEGIVSDIKGIAKEAHDKGLPLIVDAAHGAHLVFNPLFPQSAQELGADATIISLHKTLPSLTQTGLLLLNGNLIDRERIRFFWNAFQTSSPSYVLMGSISACLDLFESEVGKDMMEHYVKRLITLRLTLNDNLENIKLMETDDPSKLVFLTDDGKKLYDEMLLEYKIQFEMGMPDYALAMTSPADTKEMYTEFSRAIRNIDAKFLPPDKVDFSNSNDIPEMGMAPWRAVEYNFIKAEDVKLESATGKVAVENICVYPPGIPVIVAGEIFDDNAIGKIRYALTKEYEVYGVSKKRDGEFVRCLIED